MSTRSGQTFRGKLSDNQRDAMLSELSQWIHALETGLSERVLVLETGFATLQKPATDESSSTGIPQIVPCQADALRRESIHDFIERLFYEKDHEEAPPAPKVDDITKRVKVDVADFSGRLNA